MPLGRRLVGRAVRPGERGLRWQQAVGHAREQRIAARRRGVARVDTDQRRPRVHKFIFGRKRNAHAGNPIGVAVNAIAEPRHAPGEHPQHRIAQQPREPGHARGGNVLNRVVAQLRQRRAGERHLDGDELGRRQGVIREAHRRAQGRELIPCPPPPETQQGAVGADNADGNAEHVPGEPHGVAQHGAGEPVVDQPLQCRERHLPRLAERGARFLRPLQLPQPRAERPIFVHIGPPAAPFGRAVGRHKVGRGQRIGEQRDEAGGFEILPGFEVAEGEPPIAHSLGVVPQHPDIAGRHRGGHVARDAGQYQPLVLDPPRRTFDEAMHDPPSVVRFVLETVSGIVHIVRDGRSSCPPPRLRQRQWFAP